GPGRDDQARAGTLDAIQNGEDLDGFSESHIVGQATADAEAAQKLQPAETFALVLTQLAHKRCGFLRRSNAGKRGQFLANAGESVVEGDFGLFGEKRIEQTCLMPFESQCSVAGFSEGRYQT